MLHARSPWTKDQLFCSLMMSVPMAMAIAGQQEILVKLTKFLECVRTVNAGKVDSYWQLNGTKLVGLLLVKWDRLTCNSDEGWFIGCK